MVLFRHPSSEDDPERGRVRRSVWHLLSYAEAVAYMEERVSRLLHAALPELPHQWRCVGLTLMVTARTEML